MTKILISVICFLAFNLVKSQDKEDYDALEIFLSDSSVAEALIDYHLMYCDGKIRLSAKNLDLTKDYYLANKKLDTSSSKFEGCTWIYFSKLTKEKYSVLFKTTNIQTADIETSEQLLFKFKVSRKKCQVKNLKVIKRQAHARY